jgi:tRNA dimethylallyltransferase
MRKVALGIYGSPATIDHTEGIFQSIGYKEFAQLDLDQGNPTTDAKYAQALAQTKSRTYQYAKSQLKWIRKQLLPVVTEARALGGEVFVYAVPGGAGGEGPARRVLDGESDGPAEGIQTDLDGRINLTAAFLAGEAMPDWKESGHADAEALLREVYDPKAAEQKLPDTAA